MLITPYFVILFEIFDFSHELTVNVAVQTINSFNGPEHMGIGMGHSHLNGNWLKFLERLDVNAARLFVTSTSDLRDFIGNTRWGQNLNGSLVASQVDFLQAINTLRTRSGRNRTFSWTNPVKWSSIYNALSSVGQSIYGSDENTIDRLKVLKINTLIVEHMGCSSADTTFQFSTMNPNNLSYWYERWELYKHSYAMAIWARQKGLDMIEFYNEPDLYLSSCLDANKYIENYYIRSLSIQHAYDDLNSEDPLNQVRVKVIASAFARKTYGADLTRYLGDISVQKRNFNFALNQTNSSWLNMHLYSIHSYGKIGWDMADDFNYLTQSILNDTSVQDLLPVIITEHNTHTSSEWDTLNTTADDAQEASRLASQIISVVLAKITSLYVFKFSITPSFAATRDIAKNGLHWGEIYTEPFHLSDSTLSGEAMRLLMKLKKSKLMPCITNDTSKYRSYFGSTYNDGYFFLHFVNDKNDDISLNIDLSRWNISQGTQIIVERVGYDLMGEVTEVLLAPQSGTPLKVSISQYSTVRLTIPALVQNQSVSNATLSCTSRAGSQSNMASCAEPTVNVGTSATSTHENTSVILLKFSINNSLLTQKRHKTLLRLQVQDLVGNRDVTIVVLGVRNHFFQWNESQSDWQSISNQTLNGLGLVLPLQSGTLIRNVSQNFIHWNSNANLTIVGHITAKSREKNETKLVDVSDFVDDLLASNGQQATFLLYRPFRHPSYKSSAGLIPADDLSNGTIIRFLSVNSQFSPQIVHYFISNVTSLSTTMFTSSLNTTRPLNTTGTLGIGSSTPESSPSNLASSTLGFTATAPNLTTFAAGSTSMRISASTSTDKTKKAKSNACFIKLHAKIILLLYSISLK